MTENWLKMSRMADGYGIHMIKSSWTELVRGKNTVAATVNTKTFSGIILLLLVVT
jgi:hypothetical protein